MYDGRWNLDVLYTGFDSDKFKSDMGRLDEVNGLLAEEAKRIAGRSPRENLMAIVPLLEERRTIFRRWWSGWISLLPTIWRNLRVSPTTSYSIL